MSARQPKSTNNSKKNLRLKRVTALLIAAGCIAGPVLAQTVIIGNTTTITVNAPPTNLGPVDTLILGNTATGNGTLNFSGGTLNVNHVGGYTGTVTVGNSGTGTLNQSNANGNSVINITGPQYVNPLPGNFPDPWGGTLIIGRNDNSSGTYTMTSSNANTLELNIERDLHIGGSFFSTELGGGSGSTCTINCSGHFVQNGGAVTVSGAIYVGIASAAASTYTLNSGTLFAQNGLVVGYGSSGNNLFTQNGGTVTAAGSMFVGANGGSNGTYILNNGTLNSGAETWLGVFGTGTITQIGGDHNARQLLMGRFSGGDGTYNLIGGTFTVGNGLTDQLVVGHDGVGTVNMKGGTLTVLNGDLGTNAFVIGNNSGSIGVFTQTGGAVQGGRSLTIGQNGGTGTYNLNTDTVNFTTPTLNVGFIALGNNSGQGTFNQQAGTSNTAFSLFVGHQGTYNLDGGNLKVTANQVGQGSIVGTFGTGALFNQTGGTHTANYLTVGGRNDSSATYTLSGGALNVAGQMFIGLGHDGPREPNRLNGLFQQTGGTITSGQIFVGGFTEFIPGPNPGDPPTFISHFGTGRYELSGGIANSQFTSVGYSSQGRVLQTGGVFNAGELQLGGGGLFAEPNGPGFAFYSSGTYDLSGGQLNTTKTTVSVFGLGTFNHSGTGEHIITGNLTVGSQPASTIPNTGGLVREGIYNFSGGTLTVSGLATIGAGNGVGADPGFPGEPGAKGTFNQTGGTASMLGDVIIGGFGTQGSGQGFYNLTGPGILGVGGALIVAQGGATAVFTQSAGTVTVAGFLTIGEEVGANGTYRLSGGTVTASNTILGGGFVGNPGTGGAGTFEQTGGTFRTGFLNIGGGGFAQKGTGTYTLSAGNLIVDNNLIMGNNVGGSATFNQTGGSVQVNSGAFGAFIDNGTYTLSGTGTLSVVSNLIMGGVAGVSSNFNQSGTTQVTLGHDLSVAQVAGSTAAYSLTSSGATLTTGRAYVGESGTGTFTQTAGTVSITAPGGSGDLIIGSTASGNGTYNMSGGNLIVRSNSYIGDAGKGRMNLTGNAAVTVTGNTYIGNNGTGLNTGKLTIANNSSYTSTGAVPGGVTLGQNAGSSGSIVISDAGTLSTNHRLTVGAAGTGTVSQSGTSIVTAGGLRVGEGGIGSSTYTMNGGTLNVFDGSGVEGGTRIGLAGTGTFNMNAGTHNTTYMEIGGTNFAQGGGGTGVYNLNGGTLVASGNISINPQGGSSGTLNVAGGALTAPLIINKDKLNYSGGSITANVNNSANVNVSGGAARTLTGNLSNSTGGVLTVAAATPFTVSGVLTNAAGASIVAGANITVGQDYNNLAAGSGNAYNRRANVTGAGQILAAGAGAATAQTLSGNVTGANAAGATMNFGNVRVGQSSTQNYAIGNSNTGGPNLRGAIQTTVNGANLTDVRLSGAGVTAGTWGPVAAGGTNGGLGVTFTASSAGALSNQKIAIVNNFENTNSQVLTITGAAFNVAVGSTVTPVTVANQRIGGSTTAALNVTNAAAPGSFSEDLNVSVGGTSGATGTGTITGRVAGTNNTGVGAINVGVSTVTAGAKSGTVTLNYQTAGTVNGISNGLGTASTIGNGPVTVNGNVYQIAQPSPGSLPATVNLGNFRTGAGAQSSTINIANTNVGAPVGFQEGLAANIGTTTGGATGTGFTNAVASATGALQVGLSGIAAGINTGTVQVQLQSNGITTTGSNGLGSLNLGGPQTVTVSGTGYALASGQILTAPLNFNVQVGQSVSQVLQIKNNNGVNPLAFTEDLSASFGITSGIGASRITGTGSISNLLAGVTSNAMTVNVDTTTAGNVSGAIRVNYTSTGTVGGVANGLGSTALTPADYSVIGTIAANVIDTAKPVINGVANPGAVSVNLGNVRINTAANQNLNVLNQATGNQQAALNASIASNGVPVIASGSFSGLTPGNTNNTSLNVGINTSVAGVRSGSATVSLVSDITAFGNCAPNCTLNLANQTVNVTGTVYNLANPTLNTSSVTIAARVGDALATTNRSVSITNTSPDAFTEGLKVNVTGTSGSNAAGSGSIANLAAQGTSTGAIQVALASTATAGTTTGGVNLGFISTGVGTTGAADIAAQTASGTVNVTGKVYQTAVASVAPTVNFGIVHVGDTVTKSINVANIASGALVDSIVGSVSSVIGAFTNGGGSLGAAGVASGANSNALTVGIKTNVAGVFTGATAGSATLALLSHDADLTDASLVTTPVSLTGTVNKYANADFHKLSGAGAITRSGNIFTLDFGTVFQNSGSLNTHIDVQNLVGGGPADLLSGGLTVTDNNDGLINLLLGTFGGVGADAFSNDLLSLTFASTLGLGLHQDSIALTWRGTNGSGFSGTDLGDGVDRTYTLNVIGNIIAQGNNVPEPGTLLLMTIALAGFGASRRRKTA